MQPQADVDTMPGAELQSEAWGSCRQLDIRPWWAHQLPRHAQHVHHAPCMQLDLVGFIGDGESKDAEALLLGHTVETLCFLGLVRSNHKPDVINPLNAFHIAVGDLQEWTGGQPWQQAQSGRRLNMCCMDWTLKQPQASSEQAIHVIECMRLPESGKLTSQWLSRGK